MTLYQIKRYLPHTRSHRVLLSIISVIKPFKTKQYIRELLVQIRSPYINFFTLHFQKCFSYMCVTNSETMKSEVTLRFCSEVIILCSLVWFSYDLVYRIEQINFFVISVVNQWEVNMSFYFMYNCQLLESIFEKRMTI